MSDTVTDVVNMALQELGVGEISSINDSGKPARVMRRIAIPTRDKILRECTWTFASKRATLAEDPTDPIWGFDKKYRLPADFLYLESIQCEPDYKIEGAFIATNETNSLNIQYISVIEDINLWDDSVIEAWAFKMAFKTCISLGGDMGLRDRLDMDYKRSIIDAKRFNGQEDAPVKIPDTGIFKSRDNYVASNIEGS